MDILHAYVKICLFFLSRADSSRHRLGQHLKLAPARPYRRGRRAQGDRPSDGHERGPARYSGGPPPPRSRHGLLIPAALLRLSRRSGGRWMTQS